MAGLIFRPILPKRPPVTVNAQAIRAGLERFASDMVKEMQAYPGWMPWKSRPPKAGPRAGGKRTGILGKGWIYSDLRPTQVLITNPVPYAGYVQGYRGRGTKGEKQTKVMMARGWQSISDRAKTVWAKHVPFLKLIIAGKR